MADGQATLDGWIRRVRELGTLTKDVAPEIAVAVHSELSTQIARGVGPDGRKLEPTKDGKQPLRNAAKALRTRAIGTRVVAVLEGPEALHHLGRAKGGVRRPILPTSKIPDPMSRAIAKTITARFRKTMGGAR
jgi:hypothetical protein